MNGSKSTRITLEFPLQNQSVSGNQTVLLSRPFVNVVNEFGDAIQLGCFVDTGSAVSIISFRMRREFPPRAIATTRHELTSWNDYPCDFGETSVRLHDPRSRHVTQPLRVVGKFLRVPVPFHNDRFIILGLKWTTPPSSRSPGSPGISPVIWKCPS